MTELELLASTLTILAREAAPHLKEWGGQATAAALKSVVGEKAKQAAEAPSWPTSRSLKYRSGLWQPTSTTMAQPLARPPSATSLPRS